VLGSCDKSALALARSVPAAQPHRQLLNYYIFDSTIRLLRGRQMPKKNPDERCRKFTTKEFQAVRRLLHARSSYKNPSFYFQVLC
jgi:hypothetical protein